MVSEIEQNIQKLAAAASDQVLSATDCLKVGLSMFILIEPRGKGFHVHYGTLRNFEGLNEQIGEACERQAALISEMPQSCRDRLRALADEADRGEGVNLSEMTDEEITKLLFAEDTGNEHPETLA